MFEILVYTLAGGVASLLVYLFFWRKGQFEDCEDIKYEIFHEDHEDHESE